MGKSRRGEKEFTDRQRLIHENQKLKRQISSLRKQLARIDLDRYSHLKDIIDEHYENETEPTSVDMLEKLKNEWKCRECPDGFLEIFLYSKVGETWYFRKCNGGHCSHRTKSQQYDPNKVRGIVKQPDKPDKKG